MSAARSKTVSDQSTASFRGERVAIGDRRLRIVRAGPRSVRPTIVLEAGAFGCAADWAEVQERLADAGLHSLAYDRAGLGFSDPGPMPRDGDAIVADLAAMLESAGETGPFVMVGHSMGGLMARLFAARYPRATEGLVLVDAATPEAMATPSIARAVARYGKLMRLIGWGAHVGIMRPAALLLGDLIGLPRDAAIEKRRIYGSRDHARWSAHEVQFWPAMAEAALATGPLARTLPVVAVHAGAPDVARRIKTIQSPALDHHLHIEHVPDANHASLLGRRFAQSIVRAVERVLMEGGHGRGAK